MKDTVPENENPLVYQPLTKNIKVPFNSLGVGLETSNPIESHKYLQVGATKFFTSKKTQKSRGSEVYFSFPLLNSLRK